MGTYDRATTVFSPDGQLLQVRYAQEAVQRGSPAVGIRGNNVIVFAVEKRAVKKLQCPRTERKIVELDKHIVVAYAGLRADARVLVSRAQIECQAYRLAVDDPISVEYIARYLAEFKQIYTQNNGRRPFGISCLVGGFNYDGTPHLFQTEPSGICIEWKAAATGRHEKTMLEFLEENYHPRELDTDDKVVKLALRALLKAVHTGQTNLDVAVLKNDEPMCMLDNEIILSYIKDIERIEAEECH